MICRFQSHTQFCTTLEGYLRLENLGFGVQVCLPGTRPQCQACAGRPGGVGGRAPRPPCTSSARTAPGSAGDDLQRGRGTGREKGRESGRERVRGRGRERGRETGAEKGLKEGAQMEGHSRKGTRSRCLHPRFQQRLRQKGTVGCSTHADEEGRGPRVLTRFSAPGRLPLLARLTASSRLFSCTEGNEREEQQRER